MLLSNLYAQNFLSNVNNYSLAEEQHYLKEIPLSKMFHDPKEDKSHDVMKVETRPKILEDFTTLKLIWNAGNLSFAPYQNLFDYLHRSNNNMNLNLIVKNQMTISNIKSCSHILVIKLKCVLFRQYFGAHNRSEFYIQHINCNTYKKGNIRHLRDVRLIEVLKNIMMVSIKIRKMCILVY